MKKGNTPCSLRSFFVIILSVFFLANLPAQKLSVPDKPSATIDDIQNKIMEAVQDKFPSIDKYNEDISGIKTDIESLKASAEKAANNHDILLARASRLHIFGMISIIAEAIIAISLLGILAVLLLGKNKSLAASQKPNATANDKLPKDNSAGAGNKNPSSEDKSAEISTLKSQMDDIQSQIRHLSEIIDAQSKENLRVAGNLKSFQADMENSKQKIGSMETVVSSLQTNIDKDKEKSIWKEEVESDPVTAFNSWAQTPHSPLPKYFTYVNIVKPDFRVRQDFTDTSNEAEWIRNTIGERKFLFPNPNKIDNLAGPVDKYYKMTGTRKVQGSNSVRITNGCLIKEGNLIEYQGELALM